MTIRVLVVDDEPLVRRGVAQGVDWAALSCEVVGEAANGEEGLAMARRLAPDLIITDIRMPRMDGIEMMNALRGEGCRARCIVFGLTPASAARSLTPAILSPGDSSPETIANFI